MAVPKITTSTVEIACMAGMRRVRSQSTASSASIATMSTAVATYSPAQVIRHEKRQDRRKLDQSLHGRWGATVLRGDGVPCKWAAYSVTRRG